MKEFHSFSLVLNQRVQRVRKTVKHRTAIPVVEIYVSLALMLRFFPHNGESILIWYARMDPQCSLNSETSPPLGVNTKTYLFCWITSRTLCTI